MSNPALADVVAGEWAAIVVVWALAGGLAPRQAGMTVVSGWIAVLEMRV